MKLKIGLPKGSLQESTIKMFKKAGFNISVDERSYMPSIDDAELEPYLLRAQEMPEYVAEGALDCGITGNDWIQERGRMNEVVKIADLVYAKQGLRPVRWVIAVPQDGKIKTIRQLRGKRIATELKAVTEKFFKKKKIKVDVDFSWGATEVKIKAGLADAIVELTETGSSLRANKLKELETICTSTTQFIANKRAWADKLKRRKMESIVTLLKGAILAEQKVGLKMNVANKNLKRVLAILPAMKNPTISQLSKKDWVALETVIDEKDVKRLIPQLKQTGAQDIIEYPLNKVIY